MTALLEVRDLGISFTTGDGRVEAVRGISFEVRRGEALGIVGESGCGKTQTALAILSLLDDNATREGELLFDGERIDGLGRRELQALRGNRIAMIFQDPMTSLNPHLTVETQMAEVLQIHRGMNREAACIEAARMLDAVRIPDARQKMRRYPHEFSGGMRQRVMIAMSLLCNPDLLIADEPTTALDVTVQAEILELLNDLRRDFDTAVMLITHDLGVVAGTCDRVAVMYAGEIVEAGTAEQLFAEPLHPYTRGLLASVPSLSQAATERLEAIPGSPPPPGRPGNACLFAPRCPFVFDRCKVEHPALRGTDPERQRACHLGD